MSSPKMVIINGKPAEFVGEYELLEGLHSREENMEIVIYCPQSRLRQLKADNDGKRLPMGGHLVQLTAEEVRFFRVHGKERFKTVTLFAPGWEIESGSPVDLMEDFTGNSAGDLIMLIATTTDSKQLDLMLRAEQAERNRVEVIEFIQYRKLVVSGTLSGGLGLGNGIGAGMGVS
jgi:hypothetical protein